MYDEFAEGRLQQLPELADTDWKECRRRLSRLYFAMIQMRLNGADLGESEEAIGKTCDYLRRLANTLEQYLFNEAVWHNEEGLKRTRAYAFMAAEAIDLWCSFAEVIWNDGSVGVEMAYARIESALLYLASDYQVNAHCCVNKIKDGSFLETYDYEQRDGEVIQYLQEAICTFATGNLESMPNVSVIDYEQYDIVVAARVSAMVRLGALVEAYCEWLTGKGEVNDVEEGLRLLSRELQPPSKFVAGSQFADLFHLCTLLIHVVRSSEPLALMHELPRPDMDEETSVEYEAYLAGRASQRPFLWPSAKEYVKEAFPGPHADAVVIVPTGSGKSFLAELACSQAMQNGWVLYLAPTNALVRQVQRDLRAGFHLFGDVQILSFVGGQEYTSLAGEQLESPAERSVAVMTPEKCAMAFRINPNVFENCRLCIVDEFHLIDDEQRGITLDLCLAQILTTNPETRLLLMSAMVANGSDIAGWLGELRNGQSVPLIQIPWRPCRTMRSLLIVNKEKETEAFRIASAKLKGLPAYRKNVKFEAPLGLLGGMCLRWEENGEVKDYVSIPAGITFEAKASRGNHNAVWDSWKNTAGCQLSKKFRMAGSNVLCFILTSKHHVFSRAENCRLDQNIGLDEHAEGLLALADAELGVASKVGELLRRGVGVHSRAMLDTEQRAVERSFGNRVVGLLFATPTLAQGLNLPADVVVVAGSALGDPRQARNRSSDATILNAFGRAGRAMVANHGLAVLVSDNPFFGPVGEGVRVDVVIQRYRLLSGSDNCVQVSSPIESFVERVSGDEPLDTYSVEELELVAQLGKEREQSTDVLNHTFGAYLAQKRQAGLSLEAAAGRIQDIGVSLVKKHDMPEWLPTAAMKGGIDLLTCWRLWCSGCDCGRSLEGFETANVKDCLTMLIKVMERMPPKDIRKILPESVRAMNTVLDRMLQRIGDNEYAIRWEAPEDWVKLWQELGNLIWMYMNGSTYADMASVFLGIERDAVHGKRSRGQDPIPAMLSFVGRVLHHLSIYAGALLVVLEESDCLHGELGEMPLLPLCVRNGCGSRDSLAWFRYGYRNRMAAHEFAKRFPVPEGIQDEDEIKRWITQQWREWRREDAYEADGEVLRSVRTILSA